jgi:hypothetical protein
MRYLHRSLLAVVLVLSACDSTGPDPFPDLIGRYTFDALFRDALASDVRARGTLNFTHVDSESGRLIGDSDITLTITGEQPIRFTAFELATVDREGQISYELHLPDLVGNWRFTGTVSQSGETMHGNHVLTAGDAELLGTWTAARM